MISKLIETTIEELKKGYTYNNLMDKYICNVCGKGFENGEMFKVDNRYFNSEKMMKIHMENEHGDMLNLLMAADKKYTGLTENQAELLKMFKQGMTDAEIAKKSGVATSTIRHQRFSFREKAKQAKLYLAVYELVFAEKAPSKAYNEDKIIEVHKGAKMVDDRYFTTDSEEKQILSTMFSSLSPMKLKTFPAKEKKKIVVLKKITEQFENKRIYTEKEINEIIKAIYDDFATIRRYLIEYGFMERTNNCKEYWVK